MYVQGVDNFRDINFNGRDGDEKVTYGDVFLQAEQEYSRHNFEHADTEMLFRHFRDAENACRTYLDAGWEGEDEQEAGSAPRVSPEASPRPGSGATGKKIRRHLMAQPAYDQCIKASHVFNLLDARGVIPVTDRQRYILRARSLSKRARSAWLRPAAGARGRAPK